MTRLLDRLPGFSLEWNDGCESPTFRDADAVDVDLYVYPAEFIGRELCPDADVWGGTLAMNETWAGAAGR